MWKRCNGEELLYSGEVYRQNITEFESIGEVPQILYRQEETETLPKVQLTVDSVGVEIKKSASWLPVKYKIFLSHKEMAEIARAFLKYLEKED